MAKKKPFRKPPKPLTKANISKALRVRPVTTATPIFRDLTDPVRGQPKFTQLESVLTTKTDDQRRIELNGHELKTLLQESPRLATVLGAMTGVRRMYVVFFRELQAIVEELRAAAQANGTDISDTLEDFAVQYCMYEAAKPFNEHQLMQHDVMQEIVPAIAAVVDRHTQQEANDAIAERAEMEMQRKDSPVQIGFCHTPHTDKPVIRRDRTLVLVGWRNALMWLADQAVEHAMKADHQVLRYMSSAPKAKDQHQLIRVGPSGWHGCANSDRTFDACLAQYVANKVSKPVDLLVVDDLGATFKSSFIGRANAASAGDGQRRIRKWADAQGIGVIGLIPQDDKTAPDISGPEYEQLRTFCDLRAVTVVRDLDSEQYRITVGKSAAVFDVDQQVLDTYGSVLAVPSLEIE